MHIYSFSEKIRVVLDNADWKEADDYLMMRRLYQYICQFQTFRLFSTDDTADFVVSDKGVNHAPDYITWLSLMRLEIDGECVLIGSQKELLSILHFAEQLDDAHEAVLTVYYGINRVNSNEDSNYINFRPAFEFFDLGDQEPRIAPNVGIQSEMLVPDIIDEAYFYHYSGIGESRLTTGADHMDGTIEDAKKCTGFAGEHLILGVNIPLDTDPQGIEEVKEAFKAFEETYETSGLDIWEDLIEEYKTRLFYSIERWDMDYEIANAEVKPNYMQRRALKELNRVRAMGATKALVTASAGSGKTFLAAFDALNFGPRRLLYIVHEGSILMKSFETFQKVFGSDRSYGIYNKSVILFTVICCYNIKKKQIQ